MFHSRIAKRHFRIPAVLMALLFAFFFLIPADAFADDENGGDTGKGTSYEVTYELEHMTASGDEVAHAGEDFEVNLFPDDGYTAPDEIEVYVNGELLTEGEDYYYDPWNSGSDDEDENLDDEDENADDEDENLDDEDENLDDEDENADDEDEDFDDEDEDFDDEDEDFDDEDEDFDDEDEDFDDEDEDFDDEDEDFDDEEEDFDDADEDEDFDDEDEDFDDEEEDFDDEEEDFDDEDEDFDDEDEDFDPLNGRLSIDGDSITGPVLIRAAADKLEDIPEAIDYYEGGEPLAGLPTDKSMDTAYADGADGTAGGASDEQTAAEPQDTASANDTTTATDNPAPKTGDTDGATAAAAVMLLSGICLTALFLTRKRPAHR